jgi:hypothetical protein
MLEAKEKDRALLKLRDELRQQGIVEVFLASSDADAVWHRRCVTRR